MPDFDAGTYFFTALIPVRTGPCLCAGGVTTPVNALRAALALLPTAHQSPESEDATCVSPFARERRTHFARFAVLDDVTFNGRVGRDALLAALTPGDDLPERADRLACPYLIFAAEFDAAGGDDGELDSWLRELWRAMEPELRSLFTWCRAFEDVTDARGFVRWMKWCRIETTFPFHDYWTEPPELPQTRPAQMAGSFAAAALPVAAAAYSLARGLMGWRSRATLLGVGLGGAAGLAGLYRRLSRDAERPSPRPSDADLPAVLKSLYLQQRFSRFVGEVQGEPPDALHARFGAFLQAHRPAEAEPTQAAGVVVTPEAAA